MIKTAAGLLAALYADPSDLLFQAQDPVVPSLPDLWVAYLGCVGRNQIDAAHAVYAEICRLSGQSNPYLDAIVHGNATGLWRVH